MEQKNDLELNKAVQGLTEVKSNPCPYYLAYNNDIQLLNQSRSLKKMSNCFLHLDIPFKNC